MLCCVVLCCVLFSSLLFSSLLFSQLSESDVEVAMADIDTGGDNEIEFDEMVNWLERENLWDPQRAA